MALESDRCICLRKTEFSETSQIVTLLAARHGILRLIAKGAHRRTKAGSSKFDGGVDLLDVGQAVFSHRPESDLPPLAEWTLLEGNLEMRKSLRALYVAQYAAEMTGLLIEEHDPHPPLFMALRHFLSEVSTPRVEEAFLAYELALLTEAGYLPNLKNCGNCGAMWNGKDGWSFSADHGGMICRACETLSPGRMPLDPRLQGLVLNVLGLPRAADGSVARLPRLTRHQTDPINAIVAQHVQYTLSRRLRVARYVLRGTRRAAEALW